MPSRQPPQARLSHRVSLGTKEVGKDLSLNRALRMGQLTQVNDSLRFDGHGIADAWEHSYRFTRGTPLCETRTA